MHPSAQIVFLERVGLYKAPPVSDIKPHQIPPGYEYIELLTGGRVSFETEHGLREFGCGTLFWHIPGDYTIHKNNPDAPYRCLTILFRIGEASTRRVPRWTIWERESEVLEFSEEILHSYSDSSLDREILCSYAYTRLFWQAYSQVHRKPDPALPLPLRKMILMIDQNFAANLSISDIAAHARVSIPHLHALCRLHLQQSPHQHLMTRRLQEARHLLLSSEAPIKKIYGDCGFMNVECFCRSFRKRFGVSPGEYRRQHGNYLFQS
ncbi:MAG: hypothetical protein A2X49_05680 [Lentisphaerae bacterium GWF2_52_8]|nr:MAG: hypothetical protein A2X49_05680 [Lentisphaerae bacterium GWF2_52_8]